MIPQRNISLISNTLVTAGGWLIGNLHNKESAKACWKEILVTSISPRQPWMLQMTIHRINCWEALLPKAGPIMSS